MAMRLYWLAVPALNTLFQVLIKRGAEQMSNASTAGTWMASGFASRWILGAIIVEVACFFLWMDILERLDLSKAFPLSGISYMLIIASGWVIFGEPVMFLQMAGGSLILAGVWLIGGAGGVVQGEKRPMPCGTEAEGPRCRG
jgi:multidrug transporter EmrE-like cation transporter